MLEHATNSWWTQVSPVGAWVAVFLSGAVLGWAAQSLARRIHARRAPARPQRWHDDLEQSVADAEPAVPAETVERTQPSTARTPAHEEVRTVCEPLRPPFPIVGSFEKTLTPLLLVPRMPAGSGETFDDDEKTTAYTRSRGANEAEEKTLPMQPFDVAEIKARLRALRGAP